MCALAGPRSPVGQAPNLPHLTPTASPACERNRNKRNMSMAAQGQFSPSAGVAQYVGCWRYFGPKKHDSRHRRRRVRGRGLSSPPNRSLKGRDGVAPAPKNLKSSPLGNAYWQHLPQPLLYILPTTHTRARSEKCKQFWTTPSVKPKRTSNNGCSVRTPRRIQPRDRLL